MKAGDDATGASLVPKTLEPQRHREHRESLNDDDVPSAKLCKIGNCLRRLSVLSVSLWFKLHGRRNAPQRLTKLFVGMGFEFFQGDELERRNMGGADIDRRRHAGPQRLLPTGDAQAPAVARLQTGKAPFGHGGRQIVAPAAAELEKFFGHAGAHDVNAVVARAGVARAVAIKAGARLQATDLEGLAADIFRR